MNDWHANITKDVFRVVSPQQLCNTLPAVLYSVQLLKVVFTAIGWDLKLWACSAVMLLSILHVLHNTGQPALRWKL